MDGGWRRGESVREEESEGVEGSFDLTWSWLALRSGDFSSEIPLDALVFFFRKFRGAK